MKNNNINKSMGNYFFVKRIELKSNFTQIPNELFYIDLTATEKLILAYLLSNAETFRITNYRIAKSVGSDHRTIKRALKKFRDMKLIIQDTGKTISINVNQLIKLASMPVPSELDKIENSTDSPITDNGNSPISSITDNGTVTNGDSTSNIIGQLPSNAGNSPNKIPVEVPGNNTNQKEIKDEKQKEDFSFSATDIQDEINNYLLTPSKYFWGNNVNLLTTTYSEYRVQYQNTKLNSIHHFDKVLYYYLLRSTNVSNVHELNEKIQHPMTISMAELHNIFNLIISKKEINDDYKNEVLKVINSVKRIENAGEIEFD